MNNIGKKIKKARIKQGLTLDDLSNITGISKSSLVRYETNKSDLTIKNLETIADALFITPASLISKNKHTDSATDPFIELVEESSGCELKYDSLNNFYQFTFDQNNYVLGIRPAAFKEFKDEVMEFIEFKMQKLIPEDVKMSFDSQNFDEVNKGSNSNE